MKAQEKPIMRNSCRKLPAAFRAPTVVPWMRNREERVKHFVLLSLFLSVCLVVANAQTQRPEPGNWWGISPGVPLDEPLQIQVSGDGLLIVSAPSGEAQVSWGPIAIAPDGMIEFHRAGDPAQLCTLKRSAYDTYEGSCRGSVTRQFTLSQRGHPGGFEVPVDDKDSQILAKAREILSGPSVWNRHDDRVCGDSRAKQSWSLYCALYRASLDVTGVFLPGRPVMQEMRVAMVEVADPSLRFQRGLLDFNNLESTTYADVVKVFDLAEQRLRAMKACIESPVAKTFAGFPSAATSVGGGGRSWVERTDDTLYGQTYRLANRLGPMDRPGKIPDDWLATSTSVKRRSLQSDWRNAIDASGTLPNGHQWRYASLCGEAFEYNDVPAEVASYFDRIIDAAYFR
jgi:hypothetical protein